MADFKSAGAAIVGNTNLFASSAPYGSGGASANKQPISGSLRHTGSSGAAGGRSALSGTGGGGAFASLDDGSVATPASDPLTQIYGSKTTKPTGSGGGAATATGGYRKPVPANAGFGGAQPAMTHTAPIPAAMTLEHASPVTRLLEQRKEMLRVQENLDSSKEEYARKEELFKRREEALRKKDLELQESLVLFNKYLRENEYKLSRALGSEQDQKNQIEIKKREIIAKKKERAAKKAEIEALKKEVRKKRKYRDYLERVHAQHSNVFDGIPAIIDRYNTLSETRRTFREMEEKLTRQQEEVRKELNTFKQAAENETLDLNILFSNLGAELQKEVDRASEEQEAVQKAEDKLNQSRERTVKLRWAVDHCFVRCVNGSESIAKVRNKIREDKSLTATKSKQQRINMLASPSFAAAINAQQAAEKEKQRLLDAQSAAAGGGAKRDKNAPQVTTSEADITKAVNQLEVIELIMEDFTNVINKLKAEARKTVPAPYQGRAGGAAGGGGNAATAAAPAAGGSASPRSGNPNDYRSSAGGGGSGNLYQSQTGSTGSDSQRVRGSTGRTPPTGGGGGTDFTSSAVGGVGGTFGTGSAALEMFLKQTSVPSSGDTTYANTSTAVNVVSTNPSN